jgi:hypothetical protein
MVAGRRFLLAIPGCALLALLLMSATAPPGTVAHDGPGTGASLLVPADHIDPGKAFLLIASDFGSLSPVAVRISAQNTTVELGRFTTGSDGGSQTDLNLPADFPLGWAELAATADSGASATVTVLVGPRTAATPPPPVSGRINWWQDPSVLLLAVGLALGALAIVMAAKRRKRSITEVVPTIAE